MSLPSIVVQTALTLKLATVFQDKEVVKRGALASYGLSYYAIGRQLANTVQRLLKGAKPGEIPVDQVDRVEFVVNIKAAKCLVSSFRRPSSTEPTRSSNDDRWERNPGHR